MTFGESDNSNTQTCGLVEKPEYLLSKYTPYQNVPIPAMVYFINDPDIQRSGRGIGGLTSLKVGEALYKICPFSLYLCTIFEKKYYPICPVECLKLFLNFLCIT